VDLGAEKVQPFHQPVARERAVSGCERGLRALVREILRDHRPFAQYRAVVEFEQRHVAEFVHVVVIAAAVDDMLARVDLDDLGVDIAFAQHDADRLRTAAGSVIELHMVPSWVVHVSIRRDAGANISHRHTAEKTAVVCAVVTKN